MRKSQAEINAWIREQEVRLGINDKTVGYSNTLTGAVLPTVTAHPGPYVIERLAHAAADRLIANNPTYALMCEKLDAELAEILSGGSARAPSRPNILTID